MMHRGRPNLSAGPISSPASPPPASAPLRRADRVAEFPHLRRQRCLTQPALRHWVCGPRRATSRGSVPTAC
ncbi:putative formin-like protein 5 [Iris pallida]|uniref:Formin-like protein 5 n=1 Tax=Iris pallida TaxID=29817 RepID=A0AAX6DZH6_IRIPA|nr:putative formin-like protein 5 [Iris pallida]